MNINYKEAQYDFFPNAASAPDETKRPHFMAARFNLSVENLVIFSIVSIMVVIFTFSLGVERGKRIALRDGAGLTLDAKASETPNATAATTVPSSAAGTAVAVKSDSKLLAGKTDGKMSIAKADSKLLVAKADSKLMASTQVADAVKKASGGYTVQLASYKTEKSAQKEAQALLKKGFKAFVLPKGEHLVLCVGNFQKKEEASVYGKKLKNNYQDFVVRRL
ncbi:MAG: SPOR domain-containing protein [Candidatus Omnitrophica bacterium]|nr:SPOR domain-containing protein [Candidatus Omnitrophota bacterium]